jgi:[acyl-carrier-protein] S-malonyltransferase
MNYFLFPGQGSQVVGMGKALCESEPKAMARFDEACDVIKADLKKICFEGPEESLKQTENTQPALFVVGYVVFEFFARAGKKPSLLAGHSLGEYTALCAAGAFDFATGVKLVRTRGELMSKAKKGSMAAVLGGDKSKVENICREYSVNGETVVPANYNSPDQTVISGSTAGVEKAMEALKKTGVKRVVPLPVSGAFHSPLMKDAAEEMKKVLESAAIRDAAFPVISNVTAKPVQKTSEIKAMLYQQLFSPVRWVDSFAGAEGGVGVEMGPGKVLCGLVKKINPSINMLPAYTIEEIRAAIQTIGA